VKVIVMKKLQYLSSYNDGEKEEEEEKEEMEPYTHD
jgi:cell shape-determining protein MreC